MSITIALNIVISIILVILSIYDFKKLEVLQLELGMIFVLDLLATESFEELSIKAAWGVLMFGVLYLIWILFPNQMGGGDVKLIAVLAFVYKKEILEILMIGSILGILYGLGTKKEKIPFVPFLVIGVMICQILRICLMD